MVDEDNPNAEEEKEKSKDQICQLAHGRVYGKWNLNPSFIFDAFLVLEPVLYALNDYN